jgi:hypothetical protein
MPRVKRLVVVLPLAALACGSPTRARVPELHTEPSDEVIFSRIARGETGTQAVTLRNVGDGTLDVRAIALAAGDSSFSIADAPQLPLSIPPNGTALVSLAYAAGDTRAPTRLLDITSNDPRRPLFELPVRAVDEGTKLRWMPAQIDFALVSGRTGPVQAKLINVSPDPVVVADIQPQGSGELTLTQDPAYSPGATLAPGGSFTVSVKYAPDITMSGTGVVSARPMGGPVATLTLYGPPLANAGADERVEPLTKATLNMANAPSRAPGGQIGAYQWEVVSAPPGSRTAAAFDMGDPQIVRNQTQCPGNENSRPQPCFFPDVPGIYRFALRVTDRRTSCALGDPGASCSAAADCCSFQCSGSCGPQSAQGVCAPAGMTGCAIVSPPDEMQLNAVPKDGLFVTLTWDGPGDLDLHMVRDSGQPRAWTSANDCYWRNPSPDWGVMDTTNNQSCMFGSDCMTAPFSTCRGPAGMAVCTDTTDDPRVLIDVTTGFGPEAIAIGLPVPDTYEIGVHHFPDANVQPRNATVRVFILGQEIYAMQTPGVPLGARLDSDDFWSVGCIRVPPNDLTLSTLSARPLASGANPSPQATQTSYPPITPCP